MLGFIQILLALLVFLFPAGIAILRVSRGWSAVAIAYGLMVVLAGGLGGVYSGLEVALGYGSIGLFLALTLGRNYGAERTFITTFVGSAVLGSIFLLAVWMGPGEQRSPDELVAGALTTSVDQFFEAGQQAGTLTESDLKQQRPAVDRFIGMMVVAYPAITIGGLAVLILLSMLLAKDVLRAMGRPLIVDDLTGWQAPDWLIWPVIALGFAVFIGKDSWLFRPALNLLVISLAPFFFQGLAIASFFLRRVGLPRWLRVAGYALAVPQMWILALAPVGLFDVWIRFRQRAVKREKKLD